MKAEKNGAAVETQGRHHRFGFGVPAEVTRNAYYAGLGGELCFAASLAMQGMLCVLALTLISSPPRIPYNITDVGALVYRPEHDMPVYVLGCFLSMISMLVTAWLFNRRLFALASFARQDNALSSAVIPPLLGISALVFHLLLFSMRQPEFLGGSRSITAAVLLGPALLSVLLAKWASRSGFLITPATAARRWPQLRDFINAASQGRHEEPQLPAKSRSARTAFDVVVILVIFATIYVPDWNNLSLHSLKGDEFHHWDFFAMGPTLAYSHGAALGTQAYSQYGVAWPLVFVALSKYLPLSYGNMMGVGVIWGCLYFIGVYILLRMLLKNVLLAAAGVTFAMHIWLFKAGSSAEIWSIFPSMLWMYPSLTPLRAPLDIWFFISLLRHVRSKRPVWMLTAAVLVGLAMLFITDTGLFLAMTFAFYGAVSSWNLNNAENAESAEISSPSGHRRNYLFLVLGSWVVTFAVFSLGLALASRGTFLHKEFWIGWTETILLFGGGLNQYPIATIPQQLALVCFAVIAAGYLWLVGFLLVRLLHRETVASIMAPACMAFYGLMSLFLFVGRSDHVNIYHVSVSASILAMLLLDRIYQRWIWVIPARALLCWAVLALIVAFYFTPLIEDCDFWVIHPYIVIGVCLWAVRSTWIRVSHRQASAGDILIGATALFGLAALISWVGRFYYFDSAYLASIPFSIVAASLTSGIYQRVNSASRDRRFISGGVLVLAALILNGNWQFHAYPNFFHRGAASKSAQNKNLCLFSDPVDACGLAPDQQRGVRDFQAVVARMKALQAAGKTVLVADYYDVRYYLAAGVPPWSRYSPLIPSLVLKSTLGKVTDQVATRPPAYIFVNQVSPYRTYYSWRVLRKLIRQHYILESKIGAFGIWRRKQPT